MGEFSTSKSATIVENNRWLLALFASKNPMHVLRFILPLSTFLFLYGYTSEDSWLRIVAKVSGGIFYWTFYEYSIHRYFYHWRPANHLLRQIVESFHIVHHRHLEDLEVLNAGPLLAVILTLLFGAPLFLITRDLKTTSMIMFGTTVAYYVYEWVHYTLHLRKFERGPLAYMQRFHLGHHHENWNTRFGVTNPFWDILFRTHRS
jgi:hypothetical protein